MLAPIDPLGREIQRVLELVKPMQTEEWGFAYDGYCGAASEAYLHLAGGRRSGLKVMRMDNNDGSSHWWLEGPRGVIDLTLSPRDRRELKAGLVDPPAWEDGKGAMFQNGYKRASKRASAIIELVLSRR